MNLQNSDLEKIAATIDQYPDESLPEIAFAGRSNVGKSSFINGILNRRKLAHTSSKPGKTRTVNFYNVDQTLRLVDLPGYGYAIASKNEKEKWQEIIETYLYERKNLYEVFSIVDSRHAPTNNDIQMYDWILDMGFTGFVIATKTDKLSRNKLNKSLKVIEKDLGIGDPDLIFEFSTENKNGRNRILQQFKQIVELGSGQHE